MNDTPGEIERLVTTSDGVVISGSFHTNARARGTVLLAHGLAGDRDEVGSILQRIAFSAASDEFDTVRFDFRGHGTNAMPSRDMTLAGELLDLEAVVDETRKIAAQPLLFVAASMGAVPLLLYLGRNDIKDATIVLLNPVLDPYRTFVSPGTGWSQKMFKGFREGNNQVDLGEIVVGVPFWHELTNQSLAAQVMHAVETFSGHGLIFHGTGDEVVPYDISADAAQRNRNWCLRTLPGGAHGLEGFHDEIVEQSADWLRSSL